MENAYNTSQARAGKIIQMAEDCSLKSVTESDTDAGYRFKAAYQIGYLEGSIKSLCYEIELLKGKRE